MKLPIIWSIIGITTVAIAAPALIKKHDFQADSIAVLSRRSMAPPSASQAECMAACEDAALKMIVYKRMPETHKDCFGQCAGNPKTEEEKQKEKKKMQEKDNPDKTKEKTEEIEKQPKKTTEKPEKPEKVEETEKPEQTTDEDDKKPKKPKETDEKTDEKDNKEQETEYLTFDDEEEWHEWLKKNIDYEEITPP